jgi:tripartite-type tricarboxylate transporter receptor subunit TctC
MDQPCLLASQVDGKAVKAIVVTGPQRFDSLKDVPTVAEAGFPTASVQSWQGLVASAGTPDAIVERLSAESRTLLGNDEYVRKLKQMSFVPTSATPKEFASLIAGEHQRWAPVLQAAGLKFG